MSTPKNTVAWQFQVWASFVIAASATAVGIVCLPVDPWTKGFLAMGLLFTIGSCFSLAKTIRDEQETRKEPAHATERTHPFRSAA